MTKYHCTVIFDASVNVSVEADTPEDAADQAENEAQGRQSLCHQCASELDTGDSIGVLVYDESYADELLDTRYKLQRIWVGLTDDEVDQLAGLVDWNSEHATWNFSMKVEAKLKEKNT